jgi:ATP-dependent protease ClpP protease subunit
MKKLLVGGLVALMVLIGCATAPVSQVKDSNHDVTIKMVTLDGEAVKAMQPKVDWDRPGIMKPSALSLVDEENGRAYIKLFSGLSVSDTTRMEQDFLYLENKTDIRDVTILINSPGGSAFDGLAMADMVQEYKDKGWTVRTHARGIVASAAVPIFASGSPRTAANGTIFMVHEAALWKWPGRESASDIRSQNELMGMLKDKYLGIMVKNSELTMEEWEVLEVRTSWFNTDKAREYGILD